MPDAEDILEAAAAYYRAKRDLEEKSKEVEHDHGYFLSDEYDRVRSTREEFAAALGAFVDERITAQKESG
jgi:hypothetical protein